MGIEDKLNQAKGALKEGTGKLTGDKRLKSKVRLKKLYLKQKIASKTLKVALKVRLKALKIALKNNKKLYLVTSDTFFML